MNHITQERPEDYVPFDLPKHYWPQITVALHAYAKATLQQYIDSKASEPRKLNFIIKGDEYEMTLLDEKSFEIRLKAAASEPAPSTAGELKGFGKIVGTLGEVKEWPAFPDSTTGEPVPFSGADENPPVFGRRWKPAADGFGVQRDDLNGRYVDIEDALSVMHALLQSPANPPAQVVPQWKPIETAPKDERALLYASRQKHWFIGQWGEFDIHNQPKITHWMPLPSAPSTGGQHD